MNVRKVRFGFVGLLVLTWLLSPIAALGIANGGAAAATAGVIVLKQTGAVGKWEFPNGAPQATETNVVGTSTPETIETAQPIETSTSIVESTETPQAIATEGST
jgi:hypothetical protein